MSSNKESTALLLEKKLLEMQQQYEKELESKDRRIDDLLSLVCMCAIDIDIQWLEFTQTSKSIMIIFLLQLLDNAIK